jgi:hypothetical protein
MGMGGERHAPAALPPGKHVYDNKTFMIFTNIKCDIVEISILNNITYIVVRFASL